MLQVTKLNSELNIKITAKIHLRAHNWISIAESSLFVFLFLDWREKSCQLLSPIVSNQRILPNLLLPLQEEENSSPWHPDQHTGSFLSWLALSKSSNLAQDWHAGSKIRWKFTQVSDSTKTIPKLVTQQRQFFASKHLPKQKNERLCY